MVMTENLAHILVFKTNINNGNDKPLLEQTMAAIVAIEEWSIDVEDVDRVLRVVSHETGPQEIINKVRALGFECQELE